MFYGETRVPGPHRGRKLLQNEENNLWAPPPRLRLYWVWKETDTEITHVLSVYQSYHIFKLNMYPNNTLQYQACTKVTHFRMKHVPELTHVRI